MQLNPFRKPSRLQAYSFAIVTGGLFLLSWALQAYFQLAAMRADAAEHGQGLTPGDFWAQFLASTFENWQSEFLQLVWQAAGLAFFYFWGSSQSREQTDRIEAKVDALLRERGLNPDVGGSSDRSHQAPHVHADGTTTRTRYATGRSDGTASAWTFPQDARPKE